MSPALGPPDPSGGGGGQDQVDQGVVFLDQLGLGPVDAGPSGKRPMAAWQAKAKDSALQPRLGALPEARDACLGLPLDALWGGG